jgi:hypothetical protein
MFGNGVQLLIDLREQHGDKLDGDHGLLRAWQGVTLSTSMEEVHEQYNKASSLSERKCYGELPGFETRP